MHAKKAANRQNSVMRTYSKGSIAIRNIVILSDFILLNALVYLIFSLFPDILPAFFRSHRRTTFLAASMSLLVAEIFYHSNMHVQRVSNGDVVPLTFRLVVTQVVIFFLTTRLLSSGSGFFNFMLVFAPSFFLLLTLLHVLELKILRRYRQMGGNTRTVLLVGNDPAVRILYKDLNGDASTGYKIRGYYADEDMENAPEELKRLGDMADFTEMMDSEATTGDTEGKKGSNKVDEVFCCLSHDDEELIRQVISWCNQHMVHFYYVPRMQRNIFTRLKSERIGAQVVYTNLLEPLSGIGNRMIKRTFDVVFSSVVLLILLPFLPIVALIIKCQSKGPVFFKQERTGLNGKTFMCYKFRSMHVNADSDSQQATKDDPRKFPFGNFMRKSNIDELPQFFNVLRGDMSVVGPRPHMLLHTEMYGQLIDKYMVRHFSKPGVTGYAQVTGYRGETRELWQMEERIKRDIWYIENWSLWLDIRIILMTFLSTIHHDKNAY